MAWSNKTKIETNIDRGRILTHAGDQVMVGSLENMVLIWQEAGDTWDRKSKITGSWGNKTKITGAWENKIKISA